MENWHNQIAIGITKDVEKSLMLYRHNLVDIQIEIVPAKTQNDELIIIKHNGLFQEKDYINAWWIVLTGVIQGSEANNLKPTGIIEVEYKNKPFDSFYKTGDSNNIRGFCEISIEETDKFISSFGVDLDRFSEFYNSWGCAYKEDRNLGITPTP